MRQTTVAFFLNYIKIRYIDVKKKTKFIYTPEYIYTNYTNVASFG